MSTQYYCGVEAAAYHRFKTPVLRGTNNNTLIPIELGRITASGWLREQLRRGAEGLMGHLDKLDPRAYYDSYIKKDIDISIEKIPNAGSEYAGNFWLGLVQLAYILNDGNLKKKAADWLEKVLHSQEPDGYIGSFGKHMDRFNDFNVWGISFLIKALLSYYEAADNCTKQERVLDACRRALLWFVHNWSGDKKLSYVGQNIIEAFTLVYLYTGDKALLDYAYDYIRWLSANGRIENLKNSKLYYNSNHVVAYGEDVKLPAIIYGFNSNKEYLEASEKGIEKIVEMCFQETGAPSSNIEYLSPPGSTCATEYCNFVTYAETFCRMTAITGDPKYGDLLENIVFNGAQGARKKDEKAIAYMSYPNQMYATTKSNINGSEPDIDVYAPLYSTRCCSSHSVRIIPEYVRGMCMVDKTGALSFICYGPCKLDLATTEGEHIYIEEITEYPFKQEITIKISMSDSLTVPFRLNLRIPGWCKNASVKVNDMEADSDKKSGTYCAIERYWSDGDQIRIHFPMEVKAVEIDDSNYINKRPIAIRRGPLLFALKIDEEWEAISGTPSIPYAVKGWPWYNVYPKHENGERFAFLKKCDYALNESILKAIPPGVIVEEADTDGSYPWENSPVKIRIPAKKMMRAFPDYPIKTMDVYTSPVEVTGKEEMIELVPYGCTSLRISYFPRYK